MSSRLYGDHLIMAFPSFDTATNGWVPQADISWNHKSPSRKFAFVRFPNRCKTEAEAVDAALDLAKAWIDKYPSSLQTHAITSERRQVINVADFLSKAWPRQLPSKLDVLPPHYNRVRTSHSPSVILRPPSPSGDSRSMIKRCRKATRHC